jgi:hypothetical protein
MGRFRPATNEKAGQSPASHSMSPSDGSFMHKVARGGSSGQAATNVSWTLRDVDTKLVTPAVSEIIEAAS